MITAEHFMKENTTYYLNVYQGKKLVSQKSFTTAKFVTLPILERRQGANNIGIHSWNQYFPSNGSIIGTNKGRDVSSTPKTSTEKDSPRKIEVKKEEYLVLPIRVVIPIFAEPSPITASEEAEIYLLQVKALEGTLHQPVFSYFTDINSPIIKDGTTMNSKTTVFKTNQVKSTNFDAYLTCMITIPNLLMTQQLKIILMLMVILN